ncbi:MAG: glycerol-3-phosphate acyltransferase [Christensenellales bacterium]
MIVVLEYVLLVLFSYFIGNISFARIISKSKSDDITKKGSGNPGTMNMLRTYGVKSGALTLILDVLKGVIPSLTGLLLFRYTGLNENIGLFVAGLSVIIGHMWPVIYKFKGGKGVACALGVFMVANPLYLLIAFVIGFVYLWFFDYGSVASLFIVAFMSIIQGWQFNTDYLNGNLSLNELLTINLLIFAIFFLIWFAHRSNIIRLLMGKENKANLQKSFKKKLSIQKKEEVKQEYKDEKSELKAEFKKLKAEYKKGVKAKKKTLKKQYKSIKKQLKKSNAEIMASELESDKPKYVQTSFDIPDLQTQNSTKNAKKK